MEGEQSMQKLLSSDIRKRLKRCDNEWEYVLGELRKPLGIIWMEGWIYSEPPPEPDGVWWKLHLQDGEGKTSFSTNSERVRSAREFEGPEAKSYAGILAQAGLSLDPDSSSDTPIPLFECVRISPMKPRTDEWTAEVYRYKKWLLTL